MGTGGFWVCKTIPRIHGHSDGFPDAWNIGVSGPFSQSEWQFPDPGTGRKVADCSRGMPVFRWDSFLFLNTEEL